MSLWKITLNLLYIFKIKVKYGGDYIYQQAMYVHALGYSVLSLCNKDWM